MSDFSKEILDTYYSTNGKLVVLTLKDNTILEGIFVSFIHGDLTIGDPFVSIWHFVEASEIDRYKNFVTVDGSEEVGKMIKQTDIKDVYLKDVHAKN